MPRERRFGRLRARLRAPVFGSAAEPEPAEDAAEEPEGHDAAGEVTEEPAAPRRTTDGGGDPRARARPEPPAEPDAELPAEPDASCPPSPMPSRPEPEPYPSLAPLSLGDLGETRRESVARRLRALRERSPRPEGSGALGPAERPRPAGTLAARDRHAAVPARSGRASPGPAGASPRPGRAVPTITRHRIAAAAIVAVIALVSCSWSCPPRPARRRAGTSARPATTRSRWSPTMPSPTRTPTSTPTPSSTPRPPRSPSGCR